LRTWIVSWLDKFAHNDTIDIFIYHLLIARRLRHGDAGDAVASPTLENWPLFGQKFSTFGQIIQLHSHLGVVVSILPATAKILLRLFCHSFLPLMAK